MMQAQSVLVRNTEVEEICEKSMCSEPMVEKRAAMLRAKNVSDKRKARTSIQRSGLSWCAG